MKFLIIFLFINVTVLLGTRPNLDIYKNMKHPDYVGSFIKGLESGQRIKKSRAEIDKIKAETARIKAETNMVSSQGCCSYHGGIYDCDQTVGRLVCNDGTYSPSCLCRKKSPTNVNVIIGYPVHKTISDSKRTKRELLTDEDKEKSKVEITSINGAYYWTTRENTEMVRRVSGIFIIYVAINGSGYIKLDTTTNKFIEHVHLGLSTITYWGTYEVSE